MKNDKHLQSTSKTVLQPIVIPNLLSQKDSLSLIHYHLQHKHLRTVGDGSDYRAIDFCHIKTPWVRDIFRRSAQACTSHIFKETGQHFYPEMLALNEWDIGGVQKPHFDTYSNSEINEGAVPQEGNSREWTCILYLNDNYNGGQTYFPPSETFPIGHEHPPQAGEGLLFQGLYLEHGVETVRRGPRHTISMWFTDIEDRIIPDSPIELDQNQHQIHRQNSYTPR